ncbi:MAG: tetratricopeptide repeat protein [Brevinematia bacterium]
MDIEKFFSFLGKENAAPPEKIIEVLQKAKVGEANESVELGDLKISSKSDFSPEDFSSTDSSYEDQSFDKVSENFEESYENVVEEKDEIDDLLSIFDAPIPSYEEIKDLTIPEVVKEELSQKSEVSFEESQKELEKKEVFPSSEEVPYVSTTEGEDVLSLLEGFKPGEPVEEEKVSTGEVESLLFGEEKPFEKEGELKSEGEEVFEPFAFEPAEKEVSLEGKELQFGPEEISFGEVSPEESKAEELLNQMEVAEEVSFEQPVEEFLEEVSFEESKEIPFTTAVEEEFREEPKEVEIEEIPQRGFEEPVTYGKPKVEGPSLSDEEISRAISMLKNYSHEVRKAVKDLISNGIINENQVEELFRYILSYPSEYALKEFIKTIAPFYRFEEKGRKVVVAAKKSKFEEALEVALRRGVLVAGAIGILGIVGLVIFNYVSRKIYSENLYQRGLNMIDSGYYDEAENLFKRAEEISGSDNDWYNTYALRYLFNNVPDRAVRKLEDALKIWPYDYKTSLNYVDALTKLDPPDFDKALKYSQEFRRVEDNSFRGIDLNAQVYIKMGDYYKSKSYYKDAEVLYMKYLKAKDNKHIPSLFRLISIYIRLDDRDKVDEIYDYIKRLDEKAVSEPVGIELARYYIDKNALDRAKKVLFELTTIKPKNPDFYYEMARYLFKNENYSESLRNLKIALNINPKHAKSYVLMGDIEYIMRNKNSAIENYKKAIEIDPSLKEAYFKLGDIYYENKDYTTSLGYYLEGLKKGIPEDDEYFSKVSYNIAKIYYVNNMFKEAVSYLSSSYIRQPKNPILSHFLGNIYLEMNKPDMALVQYSKAIDYYQDMIEKMKSLDPKLERHRSIISLLAKAYNNRGVSYIYLGTGDGIKNALIDWWESKNYAQKINSVYPNAEYNISLVLHPTMRKYRNFAIDKDIPDSIPSYVYSYIR